jgi:hypothetical protein
MPMDTPPLHSHAELHVLKCSAGTDLPQSFPPWTVLLKIARITVPWGPFCLPTGPLRTAQSKVVHTLTLMSEVL